MRSPSLTRIAASTALCATVVFGCATPAVAAPDPQPASESVQPTPDSDTDRSAANDVDASTRSIVDLAIEVSSDGNGPFTPADGPGADANGTNGIVRTLDAITYRVTVSSNSGDSTNERFTLTAPAGTVWAGVPSTCSGAGSEIDGPELVCNLGTVSEGQVVAVPAVLNVTTDLVDGDTITVDGTVTADDADNGTVSATSPVTTVSSAARYNLSKSVHASILRTGAIGPDGSTGVQLTYPIAVSWEPVVEGQGLLGFEASAGPMTFTDDVSRLLGDLPSDARLWNGGSAVCGPNRFNDWRLPGLPGGVGGGTQNVVDSGSFSCVQDAPGSNIDVTIAGTVTDPTRLPTRNLTGGPITGGPKAYVVSGYISIWMPTPPADTSIQSRNTFTALQTTSVGGSPNFPGGTEPLDDNWAERTLVELAPGGAAKVLSRVVDEQGRVTDGSAKYGDPWTTAGTYYRSDVSAWNSGLSAYTGVTLCDTFDRSTQRIAKVTGANGWISGLTGGRMQFAAYEMTSPAEGQRSATCDDGDGPWYNSPEDVPGGVGAVGAVRATGDLAGGASAVLHTFVQILDAPDGTRAYDFGHAQFGPRQPGWVHDRSSDPELGVGGLSDSVLITENLARIDKKIVDPGHDAADTPDATSFTVAGSTLDYALYPSLTNGNTSGTPSEVVVQDTLPMYTSYLQGSASKTPTIDLVAGEDGTEVQRLTWKLTDVEPNTTIAPLTYTIAVSALAPALPVANTVTVASPSDLSAETSRTAHRAVQIVMAGGVIVEKTAVAPVVVIGDRLEWTLGYTNVDVTPVASTDLIDVLPGREVDQTPEHRGAASLAEPVAVDPTMGESVRYAVAAPEAISLDGADPSNQPGGSTTWCEERMFGSEACPATLDEVTAVRIERSMPVPVGVRVVHQLTMVTVGALHGDRYVNRFGLRASNLALPVQSNEATIRVVAGSIGDTVWSDLDGDGLQGADEPGVAEVVVGLSGADDLGVSVEASSTTDADGRYSFDGLRPGRYTVSFTASDGRTFTKKLVGDDRAIDSDVDASGLTAPISVAVESTDEGVLDGIDRIDTIDAGLLPAATPNSASANGLATTGSTVLPLVGAALALLLLGIVVVGARRRISASD